VSKREIPVDYQYCDIGREIKIETINKCGESGNGPKVKETFES